MGRSDIHRIKEQITTEYVAAKWGLSGLAAGYSRHQYITARQERIGNLHNELQTIVGPEQAIQVVAETLANLPEQGTRNTLLDVLLHDLGDSKETQFLLDYIRDMWETMDLLTQRFGEETAQKIISAPVVLQRMEVCPS